MTRWLTILSLVLALAAPGVLLACDPDQPDELYVPPATNREALVALYKATGGPNWRNSKNWLSNAPVGEWYGVDTDVIGRVIELKLSGNRLSGEIPRELGSLPNLEKLYLGRNELSGEIPRELSGLSRLRSLFLDLNELSGSIPRELGSLSNLRELALRGNELRGDIPRELGALTNLKKLDLGANELRNL